MRVWAGDEVHIDEAELEPEAMEGVESTATKKNATGSGSARSQSMSISGGTTSVEG